MSKMSNIHLELSEQASELGFESIEEAETHGYTIKYSGDEAFLVPDIDKAYENIHNAWLKEKEGVLADLRELLNDYLPTGEQDEIKALERAIDFVEGCHD